MTDALTTLTDATLTDVEALWIAVVAAAVLVGALLGFLIGRAKSRPLAGLFLGFTFTLPGLIAISLMSRKEPAYY